MHINFNYLVPTDNDNDKPCKRNSCNKLFVGQEILFFKGVEILLKRLIAFHIIFMH